MINFKHGTITNTETGMVKDIVVKAVRVVIATW